MRCLKRRRRRKRKLLEEDRATPGRGLDRGQDPGPSLNRSPVRDPVQYLVHDPVQSRDQNQDPSPDPSRDLSAGANLDLRADQEVVPRAGANPRAKVDLEVDPRVLLRAQLKEKAEVALKARVQGRANHALEVEVDQGLQREANLAPKVLREASRDLKVRLEANPVQKVLLVGLVLKVQPVGQVLKVLPGADLEALHGADLGLKVQPEASLDPEADLLLDQAQHLTENIQQSYDHVHESVERMENSKDQAGDGPLAVYIANTSRLVKKNWELRFQFENLYDVGNFVFSIM